MRKAASPPDEKILTSAELAERWHMNERSLSNWRVEKKGPKYFKIGKVVFYRIRDVLRYEEGQRVK